MIFFDVTKTGAAGHRSGLMRVSGRLRDGLGDGAVEARWDVKAHRFRNATSIEPGKDDWIFTAELFSEEERPGLTALLDSRPCRFAAIFHDAIPLKFPQITWPRSVARHPGYLKLLSRFDRIWAVSHASREELLGFWHWQGIKHPPAVDVLALGADFDAAPRAEVLASNTGGAPSAAPPFLCLGIIEPRKNQSFLLEVCEGLWAEGARFELHLVGRVNPHFGRPIVDQIKAIRRKHRSLLFFHEGTDDAAVSRLFRNARATLFPTLAEGCGLPLLESLWRGVPCLCSDLPVLRENADGGGCVALALNDHAAWKSALAQIIRDDAWHTRLAREAATRALPVWAQAADTIRKSLL